MLQFDRPKETMWAKIALFLAVILLLGGLFGYYFQTKYAEVMRAKQDKLDSVTNSLQLRLNGSLMAVQMLSSDPDIFGLNISEIRPKLQNAVMTLGLQNAALFDVNGLLLVDATGTHRPEVYDTTSFAKARSGQAVISNRIIPDDLASAYISLRAPVYSSRLQNFTVLAAAIPVSELSKLVYREELPEGQYIFIIDENGNFIHHPYLRDIYPEDNSYQVHFVPLLPQQSLTNVRMSSFDQVKKVYIYQYLEHTAWRVTYAVPVSTVYYETLLAAAPDLIVILLLLSFIASTYHYIRMANHNREMKDGLKMERLSAATEMAAGIAHEVRNPLTSIKGFIQLMMRKEDKSNFNNYLEIILGEIERVDALIGEFQTLARPLRQPTFSRVDLAKIVSDVVFLMENQAQQRQIQFRQCRHSGGEDAEDCWIKADTPQIKQVLINLLKNAFDAVGEGGQVSIRLSREQDMLAVIVEDNGVGIAPEILHKLGTPFFTTKEGGSGLGLSICYSIIHNHGGKMKVASKPKQGSAFTVLFPPQP